MKKYLVTLVVLFALALVPVTAQAGILRGLHRISPKPVQKVATGTRKFVVLSAKAGKVVLTPPVKAGAVLVKETGKAVWTVIY